MSSGYLELIVGPMFSGKTSRLVEIYRKCLFCNVPVAVINHSADTRYSETQLSTHDMVKIPCIMTPRLRDVWSDAIVCSADVVLINEGQFFEDLAEVVIEMVNAKKQVYVCGLDGDFQRKRFGQMLDLIPFCDKITKLTSLCSLCKDGTKGIFSLRLTKETEQMVIGAENYIPVCRTCYEKNSG
jgi:thymidine kinase